MSCAIVKTQLNAAYTLQLGVIGVHWNVINDFLGDDD